jgi:hypothetical protein
MDFFDFLSNHGNYLSLVREGNYEARKRMVFDLEERNDITSGALEKILDYFKRKPEKLLEIESKQKEEMANYLKKAMRNQVLNIIKRQNREKVLALEFLSDTSRKEIEKINTPLLEEPKTNLTQEMVYKIKKKLGLCVIDINDFSFKKTKNEMHFFIEEKYGRENWEYKKDAINIFIERFENNISISKLKEKYPLKNIPSLNTEANRIIKKYLYQLKKNQKNKLFEIEKNEFRKKGYKNGKE